MDNGLVLVLGSKCRQDRKVGLNPCCDGRWSRTPPKLQSRLGCKASRLNPYCSGRWSRTSQLVQSHLRKLVLILIVVEDGLVLWFSKMSSSMERCLNPYCSGRWSRTKGVVFMSKVLPVLILIVVEDGLVLCLWVQQSM